MLSELNRVLKKDGYLILTVPKIGELHEEPHDYYRYTKYGLRYLAEKCGFEIKYIKPRGGFLAVIGYELSMYFFTTFGDKKPLLLSGFVRVMCAIIQFIFHFLDKISTNYRDTIGYILIAKKYKRDIK